MLPPLFFFQGLDMEILTTKMGKPANLGSKPPSGAIFQIVFLPLIWTVLKWVSPDILVPINLPSHGLIAVGFLIRGTCLWSTMQMKPCEWLQISSAGSTWQMSPGSLSPKIGTKRLTSLASQPLAALALPGCWWFRRCFWAFFWAAAVAPLAKTRRSIWDLSSAVFVQR